MPEIWDMGDATIIRVIETEQLSFPGGKMFPASEGLDMTELAKQTAPGCVDEENGRLVSSVNCYIVKCDELTIVIDTCAGNHKNRPELPRFHMQDLPFLERLKDAGINPEDVDYLFCTHCHADHVGWNTHLVDGEWVPVFPNATFVYPQPEYELWQELGETHRRHELFVDSVEPLMSGETIAVKGGETLLDRFKVMAFPGHSPHLLSYELTTSEGEVVFLSDVMHQPLQVQHPQFSTQFCEDPELAITSRIKAIDMLRDSGAMFFTGHFPTPNAGRITGAKGQEQFEFVQPTTGTTDGYAYFESS